MNLEELSAKISRMEDLEAIKKLQNTYQYYLFKEDYEKIAANMFSETMPDVSIEASDSGIYRGKEGINRFFHKFMGFLKVTRGAFTMHMALGPVIEIAEDGKTAKGIWFSPGCATDPKGLHALWIWGVYVNDYVKENGKWKFWHVSFVPFFRTPYDKGWIKEPIGTSLSTGMEDAPPSRWNPYDVSKTAEELFAHLPDPPEPYKTSDIK